MAIGEVRIKVESVRLHRMTNRQKGKTERREGKGAKTDTTSHREFSVHFCSEKKKKNVYANLRINNPFFP